MIYFSLHLLTFIFFIFNHSKYRVVLYYILLTLLVIFAGGRFETGNDWFQYEKYYNLIAGSNNIITSISETRLESGYVIINYITFILGGEYYDALFICSVFSIIGIAIYSKKYTNLYMLFVIFYLRYTYFQTNFMFVRQGIALVFFVYSIQYIKSGNFIKYALCLLAASLFHMSALALIFIYFIRYIKFNASYFLIVIFIALILLLANIDIVTGIAQLIPFAPIKNSIINYLLSDVWNKPLSLSASDLERIILFIVASIYHKSLSEKHPYFDTFLKINFFGLIFHILTIEHYVFNERFAIYFGLSNIFILIYLYDLSKNNAYKLIYILLSFFGSVLYAVQLLYLSGGSDVYHPYKNYILNIGVY